MTNPVHASAAALKVIAIAAAVFFAGCAAPESAVQPVETTIEVPVTRVVETTVEVPVTRVVETTVEVPVTRLVEATVEVPVTVEVPIERTVEVTREVPVTVLVTATMPPATATPIATPTPRPTSTPTPIPTATPDLATAERANLWLAIYPVDWCAPCVGVSADPAFDVAGFGDLKVIVRSGRRSETFFNLERIWGDDGYVELSQTMEGSLSSVTGASAESKGHGSLRCTRNNASTSSELVFACVWR